MMFERNMEVNNESIIRNLVSQMSKMSDKINTMSEKMSKMQKEITYLKQKQRVSILTFLNGSESKPNKTIQQWIKSVNITQRHLEIVLQKSLKDAIVQVIIDELNGANALHTLVPIKGFIQKPKTLYVYNSEELENKWILLDLQLFKRLCSSISTRFFEMYLSWQNNNFDNINSSNESQEQDMMFIQKLMDETYKTNISIAKIIEQIHLHIQISFQTIEFD